MQRIGWLLTLAAVLALGSSATSFAATHTKHPLDRGPHAQVATSAACSDPAHCVGACPRTAAATATQAAVAVPHLNGNACGVADPSKCPASCRREGAVAAAVISAPARH